MGFKRTPEGRVFFQGVDSANDEQSAPKPRKQSNPSPQMRSPMTGEKTQGQIITLLKTLNERLKATQNDRDNILKELEKTRSTVKNLEAKALDNEDLARGLARDLEDRFEEKIAGSPAGNSQKLEETQKLTKETVKELEETRRALVALERAQSKQGSVLFAQLAGHLLGACQVCAYQGQGQQHQDAGQPSRQHAKNPTEDDR